ncbi:MAG: hypothetical protein DRI95_09920 [Bacteroidetes bacterium]|nr:MAG: hypothetical protein DRI95_09920 [Bacteroidota bacterium]
MKQENKILYWFIGSFLLPPVSWLLSAWYFNVWNTEEMLVVLIRPNIPLYVIVVASIIYFVVKRNVDNIKKYYDNPQPESMIKAQKSAAFIPWFFMIILPIYTTLGDFPVLLPLEFIDDTEFLIAIAIGVPIVFLFAIPFFIQMNKNLEIYTKDLPFSNKYKAMSLSSKMTIIFMLSIIGISIFYISAAMGILHNNTSDNLQVVFFNKFSFISVIIIALTSFNLFLFKSQILSPIKNINIRIKDISQGKGDLTKRLEVSSRDETGEMSFWFNEFLKNIGGMIKMIRTAGEKISGISEVVKSSSHEVSQAASEQAASTEEISALIEEMTASIEQNANNASVTEKISSKASKEMQMMNEAGENSLNSIQNITSKISIIKDIAFQTNILALNAAVEAAAAGEHGRGFSVVASEVKKLAERSNKAAIEITDLLRITLSETDKASKMIQVLVPEIDKTANLINEISLASHEQNSGTEQINKAMQELNQITQQNASSSENIASVSNELSEQANELSKLVAQFKIEA